MGFIESSCPFLSCFRKRLHCPAPNLFLVWHVQVGKVLQRLQRLQSSSCSLFCPELTQLHEVFRHLWRLPAHSSRVCTPREQYITLQLQVHTVHTWEGRQVELHSMRSLFCLLRQRPSDRCEETTTHSVPTLLGKMWKVCWVKVSWKATSIWSVQIHTKHTQLFTS